MERAKELLRIAREAGVNCFDHAEAYGTPTGEAERIFGIALSELVEEDPILWRRSDLVITTKIFWGGSGVNERGPLQEAHNGGYGLLLGASGVGLRRHGILSQT